MKSESVKCGFTDLILDGSGSGFVVRELQLSMTCSNNTKNMIIIQTEYCRKCVNN